MQLGTNTDDSGKADCWDKEGLKSAEGLKFVQIEVSASQEGVIPSEGPLRPVRGPSILN